MPLLEAAATPIAAFVVLNMLYVMGTLALLFGGWLLAHFLQAATHHVHRRYRLVRQLRVASLCEASTRTSATGEGTPIMLTLNRSEQTP